MFKIREFISEDAKKIQPNAVDKTFLAEHCEMLADAVSNTGPSYTALLDGEIIIIGGMRLLQDEEDNTVGQPWVIFSNLIVNYKKSTLRTVKTMMKILMKNYNIKRLIADSRKGFNASQRLLEHLGFRRLDCETETHCFYSLET